MVIVQYTWQCELKLLTKVVALLSLMPATDLTGHNNITADPRWDDDDATQLSVFRSSRFWISIYTYS